MCTAIKPTREGLTFHFIHEGSSTFPLICVLLVSRLDAYIAAFFPLQSVRDNRVSFRSSFFRSAAWSVVPH